MSSEKLKATIMRLQQQSVHAVDGLDRRTHGWLRVVLRAIGQIMKPDSALTAAAIAYFAFFSLFPLILVSITIASYNLTPLLTQQAILNKLQFIAPALGQLLGPNIQRIIHSRGSVTIIALVSLFWSASTVFNTLSQIMADLWGYKKGPPVWERRGLAILIVLAFAGPALILISFGGSILASVYNWLPFQNPPLTDAISLVVAFLLDIGLFLILYFMFPHGKSTWRELLPGAIGAGLLWELAKRAFLAFISSYLSASNLIYGSVATVVAFLFWAYLSGLIFLFGAHLNISAVNRWHQNQDHDGVA